MFVCHIVDPGLGVEKRSEQNKRTLILGVEAPAAHQQMHFYVLIIELFISALVEEKTHIGWCLGLIMVVTSDQL